MILKKDFIIDAVKGQRVDNAPFEIVLQGNVYDMSNKYEKWPSLALDARSCARFGIPMSLSIVGSTMQVTIETGSPAVSGDAQDEMRIDKIVETITTHKFPHQDKPELFEEVERILWIHTPGDGGSVSVAPCPYYNIPFPLTAEECVELKALLAKDSLPVICRASFYLKP